jgi:hypothetical protein
MARLTKAGVQGRRFLTGDRLRAWWALRSQKRRRERLATAGDVPAAPSGLWVQDQGDNIFVQWDINSTDQLGFRVYRLDVGLVGTVGVLGTEYADYAVAVGNYYSYYVVAYNAAGESEHSNLDGLDFGV